MWKLAFALLAACLVACSSQEGETSCAAVGEALCARACDCGGAECAIAQGGATLSFPSEAACRALFVSAGCQGAHPAAAQLDACAAALDTASCRQGALIVPSTCDLDGTSGGDEPDAGAPAAEVLTRTPGSSAQDVDVATTIVVTFSGAMDPASLTSSTFSLRTSGGSAVAARVTAAVDRVTLVPASPLAFDTAYQARLQGARDAAGHAVTVSDWTFRTARMPDRGAPVVVGQAPHRDEVGVAESTAVKVTFSEDMDPASLNATTFTLARDGDRVDGTVTVAGAVATFTPKASLATDTTYLATVTTGAKDRAGNALPAAATWSFRTADRTPPAVVERLPAPSATNVERDSLVQLTFAEATTVTPESVVVADAAGAIAGKLAGRYDVADARQIYTFVPDVAWPSGAKVTVTVTGARDGAGNTAPPISWSFTVRSSTSMGTPAMLNNGEETWRRPAVAVDGQGNAFTFFARADSLWAARYSASAGRWYGAAKLATLPFEDAAEDLRVLADASGRAIALWREGLRQPKPDGSTVLTYVIKASRYTPGSGWSSATSLSAAGSYAIGVEATMNAAGDAVIVYVENDERGRSYPLWALRYSPGGGWTAPEAIEATLVPAIHLAATLDGDGRASAFWIQDGALNSASAEPGKPWGRPAEELAVSDADIRNLRVGMTPSGEAVAVWYGSDVQAARRDAGGGWSDVESLFTPARLEWTLELAVNDSGEAVALWHDEVTIVARLSSAGAWTKATLPGRGWGGGVALDAQGAATVVWSRWTSNAVPGSIYGARASRGSGWSGPELLEASNLEGVEWPAVATSPAGVTFATWTQGFHPWGFQFR